MTEGLWVQISLGAGIFSSFSNQEYVLNQVPRGGATLLIFLHEKLYA